MRIAATWNRLPKSVRVFIESVGMGIACMVLILLFISTMGCQGRVTFEANGYYPDRTGDKRVGDPRRPMFEGSGYSEDEGQTNQSSDYSKQFPNHPND